MTIIIRRKNWKRVMHEKIHYIAPNGATRTDTIHMTLAFFDFSESKIRFLFDYTAVMVLVAEIAFWVQNGLLKISNTRT